MSAMAGGRDGPDPSRQRDQTLRGRALSFLISSEWLIGEAAAEGLKVSGQEVERRLEEKRDSFPGGEAEFHEFLETTGRPVADIKFDIEAELASSRIRQAVASREPEVTRAQIAGYYRQNERRYLVPERRYFDIDNLGSKAAAGRVKREAESGRSFAKMTLHESLQRPGSAADVGREKAAIERAVFSARPNVLGGPVRLYGDYSLFEVRRIVAAAHQPLAQVQSSIERRLAAEQQRRALAEFARAWRKRWIARTDCHTGYVVPGCAQYKGPAAPEAGI